MPAPWRDAWPQPGLSAAVPSARLSWPDVRPRTVRVGSVTSRGSEVASCHVRATAAQTARAVGQPCATCTAEKLRAPADSA